MHPLTRFQTRNGNHHLVKKHFVYNNNNNKSFSSSSHSGSSSLFPPPPLDPRPTNPGLVIFDKDGTLIDFQFMWGSWAESFAWRLEMATKTNVREELFDALGYDYSRRSVRSGGALCCTPMRNLRQLGEATLVKSELKMSPEEAERIVSSVWQMPDPIATARPLADLKQVFSALRNMDMKIAVCTTDDHDATERTLESLKVRHMVDVVVGGDDPLPAKPAPEQIYHIAHQVGVSPQDTIMVGDTSTDMKLGRNSGAAISVGVLYGASSLPDLAEYADVLVPNVSKLPKIAFQWKMRARVSGHDKTRGFSVAEYEKRLRETTAARAEMAQAQVQSHQ